VVATTEGEILTAMGKPTEARAAFDAVVDLEMLTNSPVRGTTFTSLGELELDQHAWADAVTFEKDAIEAFEAMGGKDALDLWKPLAGLARAQRALDPKADVRPLLTRAVAIATKAKVLDADLAPIRDALARAP